MKKCIAAILALVLMLALAAPAFAVWGTMYVNVDKVKVYSEDNTDSKVIKKLKGGTAITVDALSPDGKWAQFMVEDTKHGGQMLGFVQVKHMSETMPKKYCKHKWGKWEVDKEATCEEKGHRSRTCKKCGKVEEENIKKLKHEFGKWKVTKEATCSKKGERTRTCKVCGYKETKEYLEDHTYGDWEVVRAATCAEAGQRVRACTVCGAEEKQAIEKLPHDYAWEIVEEATDHSAGTRRKTCRVCGHDGGEESFDPEGTLRRGDRSVEVYNLQQLLVDQGYLNAGGADGVFGGGTEKALIHYQSDQGLNPDGIAWPQTRQRLSHEFGPWETVREMTRSTPGERVRVCTDCGYEQHETIESGTVFERGRRGEDIRALQQIVSQLGYDAGSYDGIYGQKLDVALAGFAADHGLMVEEGKIRPSDIDAMVNAWFDTAPEETWMGEGSAETPVNLALTVTPSDDSGDTDGVKTYHWSLTNLGGEKAMFNLLLLTFGDEPDFRKDNLVMVIDGFELKANAGNSISGSFSADSDWDDGNMNFAAMAVSEATGAKWLSNTVVFEDETAPAAKTVVPQVESFDINRLPDGTYAVSFDRGDVLRGASATYMNAVSIYTQDWYDIVDINQLAVGDTLVTGDRRYVVESLEWGDDGLIINGGLDEGGLVLGTPGDSNGFTVMDYDDLPTYTNHGATTLVVDPSVTYTDASDIDRDPVVADYDGMIDAMQAAQLDSFDAYNTTIRVEGGKVVEINRVYTP